MLTSYKPLFAFVMSRLLKPASSVRRSKLARPRPSQVATMSSYRRDRRSSWDVGSHLAIKLTKKDAGDISTKWVAGKVINVDPGRKKHQDKLLIRYRNYWSEKMCTTTYMRGKHTMKYKKLSTIKSESGFLFTDDTLVKIGLPDGDTAHGEIICFSGNRDDGFDYEIRYLNPEAKVKTAFAPVNSVTSLEPDECTIIANVSVEAYHRALEAVYKAARDPSVESDDETVHSKAGEPGWSDAESQRQSSDQEDNTFYEISKEYHAEGVPDSKLPVSEQINHNPGERILDDQKVSEAVEHESSSEGTMHNVNYNKETTFQTGAELTVVLSHNGQHIEVSGRIVYAVGSTDYFVEYQWGEQLAKVRMIPYRENPDALEPAPGFRFTNHRVIIAVPLLPFRQGEQ